MRTALTALLAFALLTAALSYKIGPAAHEATVDSADSPFQIKRAALKFESAFARLESILDELRPSVLQGRFSAAELRRLDNLLLQNQNYVKIALNHTLDAQKAADASKLRDEEGKAFPIQPNQNLQRVASAANSQSSQASELGKITSVLHKAGSGTAAKKPNTPQTTNRANPPAHPKPIATAKEHASAAKATPEPTQYTIQTSPKFLSPFKPGSKQNTSKPSPKLITKPAPKVRKAAKAHTAPPLLANYPAKSYQTPTKQVQGTKNPNGSSLSQKADSEFWEKGFKDVVQRRRTGRNNKPQVKRGPVLPPNFYKYNEAAQLPAESRREDDEEIYQQDQDQSSEQ